LKNGVTSCVAPAPFLKDLKEISFGKLLRRQSIIVRRLSSLRCQSIQAQFPVDASQCAPMSMELESW